MSALNENVLYKRGENPELDKRYDQFRKMRIWSGPAYSEALSEKEVDILIKVWRIYSIRPRRLCVGDVLKVVGFADRVREYRIRVKRIRARTRKVKSRRKLAAAVKKKDPRAIIKFENIRKSAAKRASKRRESMKSSSEHAGKFTHRYQEA